MENNSMTTNYSDHAFIWDWDGYDNTPEYEYRCDYATKFGKKVLIPMCALGQTGAYMARKGFNVTAFDYTSEMIFEGKKRFGNIQNIEALFECGFTITNESNGREKESWKTGNSEWIVEAIKQQPRTV